MSDGQKRERIKQWEEYGPEAIEADLIAGGIRLVGGPPEVREQAWEWVRAQKAAKKSDENKSESASAKATRLLIKVSTTPNAANTPVFVASLAPDCGLTEQEAQDAWHYLRDKGYIRTYKLPYAATISASGIDFVEKGAHPSEATVEMQSNAVGRKTQIAVLMSLDVEHSSSISGEMQRRDLSTFLSRLQKKLKDECQLLNCKSTGDGLFACGSDIREMTEAALSIRDAFKNYDWVRHGYAHVVKPRIALHLAQVTLIWDHGYITEISSDGATTVARIEPQVEAGEVWCSDLLALAIEHEKLASIQTISLGSKELAKNAGHMVLHQVIRGHEAPAQVPLIESETPAIDKVRYTERLTPKTITVQDIRNYAIDAVAEICKILNEKMDEIVAIDPTRRAAQNRIARGRFQLSFSRDGEVRTACKVWFDSAENTLCMFVGMLEMYDDSLATFRISVAADGFDVHITTPEGIGVAGTKWTVQRAAEEMWEIFFKAIHNAYTD